MDNPDNYLYDKEMNYATDDEVDYDEKPLATKIHDSFDKMNITQKKNMLKQIYNLKQIDRELLKFELKHYTPNTKFNTLSEMVDYTKKCLQRYQWKAGGFYIEDSEWEDHDENSTQFSVKKNEYMLLNSVDKKDAYELNLKKFLLLLEKHLDKASDKYKVRSILEEQKSITHLCLYIKEKKN